ncbi:hypothetical protein LIER_26065 [Lithospermum erythrorhizon]|uniref:CCHC-type domain-containing protein n=1 Tax=Lithospermum erythrorhizon TaxID=34254 RepID=A0AAV3R954_LITER
MKDWIRGANPLGFRFDECTFWIHVRGLNAKFFTWDVASKITNSFPGCEEVELRREKGGAKFFRVKVVINLLRPLRRMVQFQLDEEVITGYLAYERLPHLCFNCGRLGHLIRQCPELGESADPKKECIYDLWIKASMEKLWVVFRLNEEPKDCLPRYLGEHLSERPTFPTRMERGERSGETPIESLTILDI